MRLHTLLEDLPDIRQHTPGNPDITGLATDARKVVAGNLFVALRGDGNLEDRLPFVPQAIQNGAAVVISERDIEVGAAIQLQTSNTHRALSALSKRFYGNPSDALHLVGVTGTKGKTSTVFLIRAILEAAGLKPGLIGTIEHHLGTKREPSNNSTPQAHDLHRFFRTMVDSGCRSAVMEVTSHGLAQHRVDGIHYEAAVFTNISRDHLDYHKTHEAYLAAKAMLFDNLKTDAHAIVNADDPATDILLKNCRAKIVRFGQSSLADIRILHGQTNWRGTDLHLQIPAGALNLHLSMQGSFQYYNATAAVCVGLSLDIPPDIIVEAMRDVQVPGRFEVINCGQNFSVIVDYAHAPAPLENVLKTARDFTQGRLICVFGCGGDRDRGKRPLMGEISAQLADFTIVTSDNPRTEDPNAIIRDILPGVQHAPHSVEVNRRKAIEMAIGQAQQGDMVIIAGKGHEDYQEINHVKTHFDDREVAREILNAKNKIQRN